MSEPMFPSSPAMDAAPATAEPAASGGSRKVLFAVGGAVAAVALGAGAFFLLTGSGGSQDDTAMAPVPRASAPAPQASPSATVKPGTTIKTAQVASRDPFTDLFPSPAATPAASAPASTTSTQVQTAVGQTPTGPKVAVTVTSIDPVKQTAVVAVNGTKYSVSVGKTFATTFMLYSVFNAQCVGVLFGDQSVPVCVSQPQLVSP